MIRRTAQVVALVGTLIVGILAVALIVSQTPWFKDWLRRYVMRESSQYLNGQLTIGGLGGNLFFGVDLSDVAIDVAGERIVAVKNLQVDYSVIDFISRGLVVDDIRITEPRLVLRRGSDGQWNLASLVKKQQQEAEREGPERPVSIGSIGIASGLLTIDDAPHADGTVGTSGRTEPATVNLPTAIRNLDAKLSFRYEPVRFTVGIDHISFRSLSPALDVNRVQGTVSVRDDDLFIDKLKVHTAESTLNVDGSVESYATAPVLKVQAASERLSIPEIARVVPALRGVRLHPSFSIGADGPLRDLGLKIDAQSEAGNIAADLRADTEGPSRAMRGSIAMAHLDVGRLLNDPAQKSDITGRAQVDVMVPGTGLDAARGSFAVDSPRVVAAGYEATAIRATGRIDGTRVTIDGRARAYGAAATARGFIITPDEKRGRAVQFSLEGRATDINLRGLPASLNAPRLATDLTATYHVEGAGNRIAGTATFERSTVEGAIIKPQTVASFASNGPGAIDYAATGGIQSLDPQRLGRGLRVAALDDERYRGVVNASFDVRGSGTTPASMRLDATGGLTDSQLFGGSIPEIQFEAHLADRVLQARAEGELAGFDPAAISGRPDLQGKVGGRLSVQATVPDITAPASAETLDATARVDLAPSSVAGLALDKGTLDTTVRNGIAEVRQLALEGPDLHLNAQGTVALTETGESSVKYRLQAADLQPVGRIINQPLTGGAVIDGTVAGNRSDLRLAGTLDGSNLAYGSNGALDVNSTFDVRLPQFDASRARVEADTKATFVKLGGTQIQELNAKITYSDTRVSFDAIVNDQGRQLQAKGDAVLHPDHSEIHLPDFALRTQGIEWRLGSTAAAAVQYGNDRVSFQNVRLLNGNQVLALDGAVNTSGEDKTGNLSVRAENVDLAQLQQLLLTDRGIKGQFSADASVSGSLSAPTVAGTVVIANGAFRDFVFQSFTSKVQYTSTGITVDARLQQNPQQWLTVTGTAPMTLFASEKTERAEHVEPTGTDRVDLTIRSSPVGLGVIEGFTTQVTNVQGSIQANLQVVGSGHDPHVEGSVAIRDGAFSLPIGGTSYTGLATTIELRPDKVIVPQFQIRDNHNDPLTIAGELAVHSRTVGAVNVSATADNFKLIDNELGQLGVDAQLKLTGELRRPRIAGEIKVEDGRIELDEVLAMASSPYSTTESAAPVEPGAEAAGDEHGATDAANQSMKATRPNPQQQAAATQAEQQAEAAAQEPAGTLMDNLSMDVRVRLQDNLVLRGTDLRPGGPGGLALGNTNVTIGGEVRARKQPNDTLRLIGTVNTVRGFYEFQGRRFEVARDGTVRFVGLADPNPILDIRATRLIDGVEARVHVTGTARAPELELSSIPPLDEADILSLIVFNRSINNLDEGERISLAQRAGAVAGGFVAAPLAESIGRALDVDLFEIQATDESGQLGPGITLGQQVSEHLFVKFHQQFGSQDTSEFIMELEIANFMRLRASGSPNEPTRANRVALRRVERAGADLVFFFSY